MIVDQVAYIEQLRAALRKEKERTEVQQQTILILSIACCTMLCLLAFYCNIV